MTTDRQFILGSPCPPREWLVARGSRFLIASVIICWQLFIIISKFIVFSWKCFFVFAALMTTVKWSEGVETCGPLWGNEHMTWHLFLLWWGYEEIHIISVLVCCSRDTLIIINNIFLQELLVSHLASRLLGVTRPRDLEHHLKLTVTFSFPSMKESCLNSVSSTCSQKIQWWNCSCLITEGHDCPVQCECCGCCRAALSALTQSQWGLLTVSPVSVCVARWGICQQWQSMLILQNSLL